jgi:methyl-accepting chemotaxis protein
MEIRGSQVEELVEKMEKNKHIMQEINTLIEEQGGDLNKIRRSIEQVHENQQNMNQNLKDAGQLQLKARILKVKIGLSAVVGSWVASKFKWLIFWI